MQHSIEATEYKGQRVRYIKAGHGHHVLLAFHGFARTPEDFLPLIHGQEERFTLIAIYLPGHSPADGWADSVIDSRVWCDMLEELLKTVSARYVSVLGYSLGGRIALHTCMNWKFKPFKLLLLAPDGIRVNVIQRLAMRYEFGTILLDGLLRRPKTLKALCYILTALGILPLTQRQFLLRQWTDENKRETISRVFPLYRRFIAKQSDVKEFISSHAARIRIVMGENDQIIPKKTTNHLSNDIRQEVMRILPDAGHDLLSTTHIKVWCQWLSDTHSYP
jgi:pimeloyl-ACP methyl ester carboxylesterase